MIIKSQLTKNGVTLTSEFSFDFQKLQKEIQKELISAMKLTGSGSIKIWSKSASNQLKSSQGYISALAVNENNQPDIRQDAIYFTITQGQRSRDGAQSIAMLLENGIGPFDMKEKILKGRDKVIIRFEYGSPDQKHSKQLPADVYKFIMKSPKIKFKQKDYNEYFGSDYASELSPKKTKFFSAINKGPNVIGNTNFNNVVANRMMDFTGGKGREINYKWKRPMFHNLYKDTYKSGNETAVHTVSVYRTISRTSDDGSWIHPGIIAKRILQDSIPEIIPFFKETVQTALIQGIKNARGE